MLASSSSVYGNAVAYPVSEDAPTRPFSPYGVTKLAMEHLAGAYVENWKLPVVVLRYFTVYGPAQRPDMAMHRFIERVAAGEPVPVYGDGRQVRDFTFVGDAAAATAAAARADVAPGTVVNVAGGSSATVDDVLALGRPARRARGPRREDGPAARRRAHHRGRHRAGRAPAPVGARGAARRRRLPSGRPPARFLGDDALTRRCPAPFASSR